VFNTPTLTAGCPPEAAPPPARRRAAGTLDLPWICAATTKPDSIKQPD
jgi:hypothetical protein